MKSLLRFPLVLPPLAGLVAVAVGLCFVQRHLHAARAERAAWCLVSDDIMSEVRAARQVGTELASYDVSESQTFDFLEHVRLAAVKSSRAAAVDERSRRHFLPYRDSIAATLTQSRANIWLDQFRMEIRKGKTDSSGGSVWIEQANLSFAYARDSIRASVAAESTRLRLLVRWQMDYGFMYARSAASIISLGIVTGQPAGYDQMDYWRAFALRLSLLHEICGLLYGQGECDRFCEEHRLQGWTVADFMQSAKPPFTVRFDSTYHRAPIGR